MRDRYAVGFLLFLGWVIFLPYWVHGRVYVPEDVYQFIYPWKQQLISPPDLVHNLEIFDVSVEFFPLDVFYNQQLHQGRLPLWNPYIFLGHPVVGSGQSALLYPFRLLLHSFLSPAVAKTWLLALHLPLAGLGFYLWLRSRKFGPVPASIGAIAFMFNAQIASWFEYEHTVLMSAWLGFDFWLIDRALAKGTLHWAGLAVLWSLQLMAGHLQLALYFSVIIGLYGLCQIYRVSGKKARDLGWLLGTVGVVAALTAPVVLPFLELLGQSQRQPLDLDTAVAPLWTLLVTLLCPDAFGNPTRHFMLNRCSANFVFPEFANFIGFIPLVLALTTLFGLGRRAEDARGSQLEDRFWWLVVVLGLVVAAALPPYRWLTALVKPLALLIPGPALLLLPPALAWLSARALQQVLDREEPIFRRRLVGVTAGALAAWMLWVALALSTTWELDSFAPWWEQCKVTHRVKIPPPDVPTAVAHGLCRQALAGNPQCYFPLLLGAVVLGWCGLGRDQRRKAAAVLVVAASLDVSYFLYQFNTTVPADSLNPPSPALEALRLGLAETPVGMFRVERSQSALFDTLVPYGFYTLGGYESVYPKRINEVARLCQQGPVNMRFLALTRFDSPLLRALAVKFLICSPLDPAPPPPWVKIHQGDSSVYRNDRALPRAFWVPEAIFVPGLPEALQRLKEPDFEPSRAVILEGEPPVGWEAAQKEEVLPGSAVVKLEGATPHDVLLRCQAERPGYLFLSDSYYPGWTCRVDGQERPIYPANGCGRGIALSAGTHRVHFRYLPRSFYGSLGVSGLTLAILMAWSLRRFSANPKSLRASLKPSS